MCEEGLFAITSTALTPGIGDSAREFALHEGFITSERAIPPTQEVLVQVYPEDPGQYYPTVRGLSAEDERMTAGNPQMPCEGGVIYRPVFLRDHARVDKDSGLDPKAGHAALQAWDSNGGGSRLIDLVDSEGRFLPLTEDDFAGPRGWSRGDSYTFITRQTRAICTVELATGITDCGITAARAQGEGTIDAVSATDEFLYILNQGEGEESPAFTLSRYSFATGEREEIASLDDPGVLRRYDMSIQGMAINPTLMK